MKLNKFKVFHLFYVFYVLTFASLCIPTFMVFFYWWKCPELTYMELFKRIGLIWIPSLILAVVFLILKDVVEAKYFKRSNNEM